MASEIEDLNKIIEYWKNSSDQNYDTMINLKKSKDFSWALFLGHLLLEKLLKAHYVKKNKKHALFTHDLLRLALKTDLPLTEIQKDWLDEITTFNLNTRYDNFKNEFHQICTVEFTEKWIKIIEQLRLWLIKELSKF